MVMLRSYLPRKSWDWLWVQVLFFRIPDGDKVNHPLKQKSTFNTALSIMWPHIFSVTGQGCQFYCWRQKMSYTWRGMLPSCATRNLPPSRPEIGNIVWLVPPQSIIWLEIKTDLVKSFCFSCSFWELTELLCAAVHIFLNHQLTPDFYCSTTYWSLDSDKILLSSWHSSLFQYFWQHMKAAEELVS